MLRLSYIVLFISFVSFGFGQTNVEFKRSNFPNKASYKEAIKNIEDGDYYFDLGGSNVFLALEYYLKANKLNPDNASLNYKIGLCYLEAKPAIKSIEFLQKSKKLDNNVSDYYDLYLAKAYHINLQFDKASAIYKVFRDNMTPEISALESDNVNRYIDECKNGKEIIKTPIRVIIENLGPNINSEYPDYGAVVNMDESVIFYSSRRPTTTGGERSPVDMMYFEDTYWSEKKDDKWKSAKNIGKPINSSAHDGVVGIAPDGQTLLIYRDDNGGDIYWSKQKGKQWTNPMPFPAPINSEYQESSASYSYDGKRLFFVSDRPGGYGGKDIYYSDRDINGNWGTVKNLGNVVNTVFDEIAVFVYADGKTLYFSSEGHYGMGGFDIFRTVYENNKWSVPQNIGYPVNSPDPDVFFSIGASGRNAYYSSNREEGLGDQDIYKITFLGPEKEPIYSSEDPLLASNSESFRNADIEKSISVRTSQLTLLKGVVIDEITQEPIEASVELIDNEEGEVLASFHSNSATGKYLISLPSGHNYGIAVSAEGYLFYSDNFVIPQYESYKEVRRDIKLQRVEIGKGIALNNIFFEYKKASLSKESKVELSRILKLMKKYPSLEIEVSGHTDNVGGADYNKTLSLRRAKSVVNYLVKNGIDANRMTAKGYGFDKPIASNDTDEGRKKNRRSEVIITKK